MKPQFPLSTLCLLVAGVAVALSLFLLTARHNVQLLDMTARHNAQLLDMTARHNAQLVAQAARYNAQLAARLAEARGRETAGPGR